MIWLIFAGLLLGGVATAYFLGRGDGKRAVKTEILNRDIAAAERVAHAEANAPTNSDQLLDELRSGKRKL